ncbi:UDP-glucuronic acid decarboxylase family protein [Chloroflexota bacterium]
MEERKVLVTGGAGFIGSWLCRRLAEENMKVICVDNFTSSDRKNLDYLNVANVNCIEHDIKHPLKLEVDYIFHLASRASPIDFPKYPIDILLTNSLGTYNMVELAVLNHAKFLLASTSEAYGDPLQHPQNEEYWGNVNPNGIRSCYDESKRFSEALAMAFHREKSLDVRIARIFNTYGGRMRKDDGRVISNFISQALVNEPVTVYGDGTQTRSFCYVTDMVEGMMKFAFTDNLGGEVINLGNPHEVNMLQVAELVIKLTGSDSKIVFKPLPQDDPIKRKPDITKAREKLNWEPRIGLEEGLRKTIRYFDSIQ